MTTWVVPEGTWKHDDAQPGDVLIRPDGENLVLATVHEAGAEWLGPVPEGVLDVEPVTEATAVPDLDEKVAPILTALAERGA